MIIVSRFVFCLHWRKENHFQSIFVNTIGTTSNMVWTYLGSMNRNLPSRLCRDVNSFSSYPHSTDLEKLGLATIPTPTKNRGSAVFPARVSEVTLCRELCMPGEKSRWFSYSSKVHANFQNTDYTGGGEWGRGYYNEERW